MEDLVRLIGTLISGRLSARLKLTHATIVPLNEIEGRSAIVRVRL